MLRLKLVGSKDETDHCTLWIELKFVHTHDEESRDDASSRGIPQQVKDRLIELEKLCVKPSAMIEHLRADPLERKRKVGAKRKTLPALVRQSVEPSNAGIIEEESEPEPEEESTRKKKKHTNEAPKRVQRRQSKRL